MYNVEIVSLAPSNTEILFEIGAEEHVVATTSLCEYPSEARKLPSIGGWTNVDVERVKELDPDLVMATDQLQESIVEELRKDLEIIHFTPKTLGEVYETVHRTGKIVGEEENASKVVKSMKSRLERVNLNEGIRIYCEEWHDPPMVSGNWVPGLIDQLGAEYLIDEGLRSRKISNDEINDFDPQFVFLNVCGAGENISKETVLKREGWQGIEAVRNKNVFVIDDSLLNRPGPRLVEGAEKLVGYVKRS